MTTTDTIEPFDQDEVLVTSPIRERIEIVLTEWKSRTIIRRSEVQDVLLDLWSLAEPVELELDTTILDEATPTN